jgi:hypothetical protein
MIDWSALLIMAHRALQAARPAAIRQQNGVGASGGVVIDLPTIRVAISQGITEILKFHFHFCFRYDMLGTLPKRWPIFIS